MRKTIQKQLGLRQVEISHPRARELEVMSACLDELEEALDKVQLESAGGRRIDRGRQGMSSEKIIRVLLIKQMNGFSYDELSFQLESNTCYRRFCRIGEFEKAPKRSTLQANIKRLSAQTLEDINLKLLEIAKKEKVEKGKKVRIDCTAVKTDILAPTDSRLLWDTVRTLTRLMKRALTKVSVVFVNHCRRAKRRTVAILNAKTQEDRKRLYVDLLRTTENTLSDAKRITRALGSRKRRLRTVRPDENRMLEQLKTTIALGERVVHQTRQRVLENKTVAVEDKVVSIFEPHTDILVKGRRDVQYGHKVCISSGGSNLILDCTIERGNPADRTLARSMVARHQERYGEPPRQAVFDGGFASRKNVEELKKAGVEDVAFSKRCGLAVTEMVKSDWVYKRLRDFRAGVEGNISFLKRTFGCRRCTWSGFESFTAYVWASILSCNALVLARHILASS